MSHEGSGIALLVHTARITYAGADRFDVTRSGADRASAAGEDFPGLPFAPSWAILGPALRGLKEADALRRAGDELAAAHVECSMWDVYLPAYTEEMRVSYRVQRDAWDALLGREEATMCCYCVKSARCHRTVLASILGRLGADVKGERE